jgi:hypothetical protein
MALQQPEDYYFDPNGLLVFTEKYLLERGFCCGNGCRHCPYGKDADALRTVKGKPEQNANQQKKVGEE